MIKCLPRSICSWNFDARGLSAGQASLDYDWLREEGDIIYQGRHHAIRKHGLMSGRWTLEDGGGVLAEAHKPSALSRRFLVSGMGLAFELEAAGLLSRTFELSKGGEVNGTIRPAHAFTRRGCIECRDEVPEMLQLFAFWLTALTWRRSANSSGSASGAGA